MSSSDSSADEEMSHEEELSSGQNSEDSDSDDHSSGSEEEQDPDGSSKLKLADEDFRQMPFEDLLQLKRRLGSKVYNEAVFGKESKNVSTELDKGSGKGKSKRAAQKEDSDSDGPPEELSAKRKVPALGMDKNRRKTEQSRFKDPRFDAKQGYFSGRKFREQYGFINDLRSDELKTLKKQLEESEDPDEAERLKFAIRRTENQILEFNKQKAQDKKRKEEKLQTRKAIDEGKRPFYEKNSTKRARELVEKYDKLTEEGKIGKHIDKRKRKITAKDRKKLDFST